MTAGTYVLGWGVLLLATVCTSGAGTHAPGGDAESSRRFDDPGRMAESWDSPERAEWQKPGALLRMLGIGDGDVVADLGAGTGYFTRMLSALVGETGKVYAVDIEPGMLAHIRAREDLPDYDNIVTVLAEPNDPKLPDGALDLILTVNTWHHLPARKAYLERLDRALRPHGRFAIVDWRAGELPMGPPPGEKVDRDTVVAELEGAGWTLISESVALPYQNALVFQKPER